MMTYELITFCVVAVAVDIIVAQSNDISGIPPKQQRRKMVIDAEPGLDDAVAIATALGDPDVEILGITCPDGNTNPDQAAKNALRVLRAAGRLDIPIFKGSPLPLLGEYHYTGSDNFFGQDGFGNTNFGEGDVDSSLIRKEHAALALVQFVNQNPGEVTIVALGPLTNLALATRLDPSFANKIKELHLMGGSATALGNRGPVSEFNFAFDPEGALIVLQELRCPIHITTWELCVKNLISLERKQELFSGDTKMAAFLHKIHYSGDPYPMKDKPYSICDSLTMTSALNASVVTKMEEHYTTVELCGENTRGEMIVDRKDVYRLNPNAHILEDVDQEGVLAIIRNGITSQ